MLWFCVALQFWTFWECFIWQAYANGQATMITSESNPVWFVVPIMSDPDMGRLLYFHAHHRVLHTGFPLPPCAFLAPKERQYRPVVRPRDASGRELYPRCRTRCCSSWSRCIRSTSYSSRSTTLSELPHLARAYERLKVGGTSVSRGRGLVPPIASQVLRLQPRDLGNPVGHMVRHVPRRYTRRRPAGQGATESDSLDRERKNSCRIDHDGTRVTREIP